jgi:hypothetical protein
LLFNLSKIITGPTQATQACKEEQGKHKLNREEILYNNKTI